MKPLGRAPAIAATALAGALYVAAFPGGNVWPLAFIAFAPFYVAIQGQTPRMALWLGLLFGTVINVGGFYWLQTMLSTFSGFPAPVCAFFTLIVCGVQGGRLALMGWLHARGVARGWPRIPLFLAAFAASELGYPLLFPWYFGACVHDVPLFTQVGDLGGPILVGLPLVFAGVALAEAAARLLERREEQHAEKSERPPWIPVVRLAGLAGLTLLLQLVYGRIRIGQVEATMAASESLHVGLVQGNMGLMQKREDPGEGLRRHMRLTRELRDLGAELVVWSESSATFPMRESMYKASMRDYVGRHLGVASIVGGVLYRTDPDRQRYYNVALSLDDKGEVLGRYDKQFLLAFGEYLPFGEMFPILYEWSPNSGKFTPGTSLDPLTIRIPGRREFKATTLICYEDILPRFTNAAVRQGNPELIVNITNDAWFGDTTEPWEHLALAQLRAVEHRRYLVRSTNSGVSAVVDPVGRIVTKGGTFRAERLDAHVRLMTASTLYETTGDIPWVLVGLASAAAAFVKRRKTPVSVTS